MDELIKRVCKVSHGFKPIELEALNIIKAHTVNESINIAVKLLEYEYYQVRCLSVFLLGYIVSKDTSVLPTLKTIAIQDDSWQIQEIVAKAFDQFCKDNGYENSLPVIREWLSDENPNVNRAVTEGLRIWTGRPYFRENPEEAIQIISQHKSNSSEYLRKSVGNSLRDISKKHRLLVDKEISTWDLSNNNVLFTYKLVLKNRK